MTAERSIDDLLAEVLELRERIRLLHEFAAELSLENFRLLGELLKKQRSIQALEATRDELWKCLLTEAIHLSPLAERIQ